MADRILRLKVESQEYDNKLKQAAQGLTRYADECRKVGGTLEVVEKDTLEYVRAIGQMDTTSRTATGKLAEMKKTFVELSAQYKQMTDAEKNSPFGKALAASLEELKPRIIDTKNQLDEINDQLKGMSSNAGSGLFSDLGDKMGGALQVFAGNMLTKAAGAVANLGSEIFSSVQQGIVLARQGEGIRNAFERLGRGDLLDGLREATHGTVTDLELMKAAVKFNDFKLPVEELGILLQFAQQKAKDTGQSVDYMVDSIVTGLGRKSLMILDNLGLSANEVKEKMKETGDMTKAVGEIIREQMSKAGDYVETAADRATKANVELTNAMTDLGNTLQPLTDASNSLWNSIKIGALNALNTAVKPLIQALAESGLLGSGARATAGFNRLGGGSKVDRMIGRLGSGKTAGSYSIYTQQLGEFDKYINNKRFQIAAYGSDNSSIAQSAKQRLQAELDGALKMRAEYVKRAKELHDSVPSPANPATSDEAGKKGGGRSGGGKTEPTYAADSIAAQEKLVQDLNKAWRDAGSGVRDSYLPQIVEAEAKLKTMKDEQALLKEQAAGRLKGSPDGQGLEIPLTSDVAFDEWMGGVVEKLENLEIDPIKIPIETTTKDVKSIAVAARMTADVVGSIGDAFNAIEDPAAKVMGTVMQAIASVALGYAQATAQASSMGPWVWLAFAASGLATMIATISTIHSQTGYAEGGMIKGNSYSGDRIGGLVDGSQLVGLNAGEVVLNAAQQNTLAQNLEGAGLQNLRLEGVISGEKIHIVHNRYLKRSGQGELVTW